MHIREILLLDYTRYLQQPYSSGKLITLTASLISCVYTSDEILKPAYEFQ